MINSNKPGLEQRVVCLSDQFYLREGYPNNASIHPGLKIALPRTVIKTFNPNSFTNATRKLALNVYSVKLNIYFKVKKVQLNDIKRF